VRILAQETRENVYALKHIPHNASSTLWMGDGQAADVQIDVAHLRPNAKSISTTIIAYPSPGQPVRANVEKDADRDLLDASE